MGIGTKVRKKTGTAQRKPLRPAIAYVRKVANTVRILSGCSVQTISHVPRNVKDRQIIAAVTAARVFEQLSNGSATNIFGYKLNLPLR